MQRAKTWGNESGRLLIKPPKQDRAGVAARDRVDRSRVEHPHGGQAIHESHPTGTATPILSASTGPAIQILTGDSKSSPASYLARSTDLQSWPPSPKATAS